MEDNINNSSEAKSSDVGDIQEIQMMEHHEDNFEDEGIDDQGDNAPLSIYQTNIPRVTCALLASITTGGVSYAFGLYGNALKKNLHLTQAQLETISSATFCAGLFSWLPGMFVDRFGTRAGITVGGITGSSTLLTYWAVAKQYVEIPTLSLTVVILSILSMGIFLSCALITGAVFKIISCSCGPGTKGKAVGVAKGYVGLGSGAYACLFQSIRTPSTSDLDFLPMCAFFFLVAATIPSFINLPTKADEGTKIPDALTLRHFQVLFGSLFVLALLIIGSSLVELFREGEKSEDIVPNYPFVSLILFVWISPIVAQIYLPQGQVESSYSRVHQLPEEVEQNSLLDNGEITRRSAEFTEIMKSEVDCDDEADGIMHNADPLMEPTAIATDSDSSLERRGSYIGGQKNLFEMLQTVPAWLMLWTATILVGGGIVETNNLGQMVESLHFSSIVTPASLSLFSVAQSGGRVASGALSDWALTANTSRCFLERGVPRPFFLVVGSVIAVVAHTILAVSTEEWAFVAGIALSGLAFGSVWPLLVLIVGEIYGTNHVGANYMFYDGFTSAAGAFLLSKVVAQQVYDRHIDPHFSEAGDGVTCYGQECFQMTHVIIAVLSLICVFSSLLLQYTTRHRYDS